MPQRSLLMLIGAIGLGLLAVLLMRTYVGTGSSAGVAAIAPALRSTPVVVAAADITPGAAIDKTRLKIVNWPVDSLPVGTFKSLKAIPAGRGLVVPMVAGEPLLAGRLTGGGAHPGIAPRIAVGMRAATVRVSDVTGAGGFILPGARVDVLLTQTGTQNSTPFNDVLIENIRVIAVNQDASEAKDKPEVAQSVTIEVSPLQAQKLALAQVVGTLSLVLRNPDNSAVGSTSTVHVVDLHETQVGPALAVARTSPHPAHHITHAVRRTHAPAATTIEVVRGLDRATYQIARSE